MSTSENSQPTESSQPTERSQPSQRDNRFLLIPALTFVVGLLLGGVLGWLGSDAGEGEPGRDGGGQASPEEASPGAGTAPDDVSPTDVTVTVPADCVDAAEHAQEVLDLARQATVAMGELDAQRLRSLVDEMEDLEPDIRRSVEGCQEQARS